MVVKACPGVSRDLLRAVVAARIDHYNFAEAGNRFQTTRQIVRFVMGENDDAERLRHVSSR